MHRDGDAAIAPPTVAALFVATGGVYFDAPGVDPWDEARDARTYPGPHPVVAHPPCAAWCRYRFAREAAWGLQAHEDGGCFAAALESVRRFGGVLEHPADSAAFAWHDLPTPRTFATWEQTIDGEWTAWLNQSSYGHRLSKPTWLLYVGDYPPERLRWDTPPGRAVDSVTSSWRSPTPPEFAAFLLRLARASNPHPLDTEGHPI